MIDLFNCSIFSSLKVSFKFDSPHDSIEGFFFLLQLNYLTTDLSANPVFLSTIIPTCTQLPMSFKMKYALGGRGFRNKKHNQIFNKTSFRKRSDPYAKLTSNKRTLYSDLLSGRDDVCRFGCAPPPQIYMYFYIYISDMHCVNCFHRQKIH